MPKNDETTTKFKVDISELKSAMQTARKEVALANSEFKAASSGMENWSKSSDGISAKLKQLNSNLKSQKRVMSEYENTLEEVKAQYGENSREAMEYQTRLNNQRAVVNNTERQIRQYTESLERAERAEEIAARTGRDATEVFDELGREAQEAGNSAEKSSGGFTVMKGVLANLVTDGIRLAIDALRDFAKEAVTTGMDFEASMSEVGAISGATGKDLELLENTAKEFGATTVFSASESAQALKYMALAGWDAEKSASALGGVLDLAAASGMDLAQASDMVTDYMSAFGMAADKSTYFADLLAFAQSNANTSAEQLGEAYKNSAANLNAAGQDVETVTALLSMMANQGFKGSEAGTALTAIMRDMTAKMKDGQIAIGKTSVTVQDAQGNYRDLTDILKDVEAATNGMGDAERATALSTTFTADSTKGLNLLLNAGVGEAAKFEEALRGAGGTAAEMGATMNDNAAGDVKALQSALESVKIALYEELQPTIRGVTQYLTENVVPGVKSLIENFQSFKQNVSDALPIIAGLGVALGGLALTALVGNFTAVVAAFKAWTVVTKLQAAAQTALNIVMNMNPIGIIISLIAGLVVAFTLLWNKSEAFRNFWIGLWASIKSVFMTVVTAIATFFTQTLPNAFNTAVNYVGTFVSNAVALISALPGKIWTWLVATITKVTEWRNNLIEKGKAAARGLTDAVINGLISLPERIKSIGSDIVRGLWNGINDMTGWVISKIQGFGESVLGGLKSFFQIGSPSKLMAKEVGKWLPAGIGVGIEANADSALKSMKNLSTEMVATARGGLTNASTSLNSSGSMGGVVNNFTQINNSPKPLSRLEIYRQSKNLLGYTGGV